jgi:hypothetical protein
MWDEEAKAVGGTAEAVGGTVEAATRAPRIHLQLDMSAFMAPLWGLYGA